METVTVSRSFQNDLEAMVAYCRTMKSRENWPGAVPSYASGYTLIYNVGMRLSAATMTDIEIDEKLDDIDQWADGTVVFRTSQRVTWPDGHADATTEYRFSPATGEAPPSLQFTYSYEPPSTKLVKTKALAEFRSGMEKVAGIYLNGLTAAALAPAN
jgi:hypothetical protein